MDNIFSNTAKRIENSPAVIFLCILSGYALFLSCNLWLEDFSANLGVAALIPTHKALSSSAWIMAAFIQIAPLFLGYTWLRDTNKTLYGLSSFMFLGIDWFIGVYFRAHDLPLNWQIYAAVEDFIFFTVGSEVLVMLSFGMVTALIKPAINQVAKKIEDFFASPKQDAQIAGKMPNPPQDKLQYVHNQGRQQQPHKGQPYPQRPQNNHNNRRPAPPDQILTPLMMQNARELLARAQEYNEQEDEER